MFDFMKKHNKEFKLDEHSLPSMSDDLSTPSLEDTLPLDSPAIPELPQETPSSDLGSPVTPIDTSMDSSTSFQNPIIGGTPVSQEPITNNQDNSNLHNDIVKTKIDSLDAKVTLMEAKISNVEQKLEVIYQLILSEVSDETKRKIKVGIMMDTVKNQ